MKVITITREFGAGGGEVGQRLAELLGWQLLDRELLHEAAQVQHVPDAELERLDEKTVDLVDRFRLHPPHQQYLHGLTEAVRQAATRGNVILVGRGARHLLADMPEALHLRLVAPKAWRVQRMAVREGWSEEHALAQLDHTDRSRNRFTRYFFGVAAGEPSQYDLTVNSGRLPLDHVVALVADAVRGIPPAAAGRPTEARRVLTLSRELGAGHRGFGPTLAARLGLAAYDRELLEQEAVRLGVAPPELEKVDEQPAGVLERFRPGSLHARYFQALEQLIRELAQRGSVLLVGRGANRFLSDDHAALHLRLVAAMPERVRRVMEYHWLREEAARKRIAHSDAQSHSFYASCFGADWASPLEYHVTVNTGRLGPLAIDLAATVAERFWCRTDRSAEPS
jgi:cytidylate kinase